MDADFLVAVQPLIEAFGSLPKLPAHDVNGRRERLKAFVTPIVIPEDVSVTVFNITSTDGVQIPIHHIKKKTLDPKSPTAAVLHAHGGGLIALSAEIGITTYAGIVHETGIQVFSVDYRLAPEHPYPAALDDMWASLTWLHANAESIGIDRTRIAVTGESAGGNLAAATTLRARELALSPPLAAQVLIYPMLDDRTVDKTGNYFVWDGDDNLTGWTAYLQRAPGSEDVPIFAAPGRITSAKDLPPLYLECGQLDLFAVEDTEYVRKFVEAGVPVEFHLNPGLPHAFDGLAPTHRVTQQLQQNRTRIFQRLQDGAGNTTSPV
ncbi:esterase/lipase [Paraphoma chrysanthemicola]|nr:esterase/lipase [Paraphoma chrysanthemicola]